MIQEIKRRIKNKSDEVFVKTINKNFYIEVSYESRTNLIVLNIVCTSGTVNEYELPVKEFMGFTKYDFEKYINERVENFNH